MLGMNQASVLELVEGRAALSDSRSTMTMWLLNWRLADLRAWRQMTRQERGIIRTFRVPPRLVTGTPRRQHPTAARWLKLALAAMALVSIAWYFRIYF